jgi:hypothetical protein
MQLHISAHSLSIAATHRDILGEIVQYTLCDALPSGLPEESTVLKGFCWELIKYEPRSIYDSKV